jgi:hypothetical protein
METSMLPKKFNQLSRSMIKGLAVLALVLGCTSQALALPSFARQTGDSCDSCHVGSFGPQLTPHGMKFKLGGYTDSDGNGGHIPVSGMLIENYTHTSADLDPADVPDGFSANNNTALQELSGFLAGKLISHLGSFMQVTYSDIEKQTALDNTEFRYATDNPLFGQEGVYGVVLNNNPSMQDPFNTLPAWRFPFTSSDFGPGPDAAPILDDGVAGTVWGVTAYTQLKSGIYAELGGYKTFSKSFLEDVNVVAAEDPLEKINGVAPYWRLAYTKDMHKQVYSVGLVGMYAKLRLDGTSGPDDKYSDIGLDGHYQYLGNRKNIISLDGSYIDESINPAGGSKTNLHQLNLAGSYYYHKTYGATARLFNTTGIGGTADTSGWMLQADWTPFGKEDSMYAPWLNLRVGLQYTLYNKLNGDSSNASDGNTFMAFAWLAI